MALVSVNPATGETIASWDELDAAGIDRRLRLAREGFEQTRRASFAERGSWLRRAAEQLDRHRERYARRITEEMGKPLRSALAEVDKCAWALEHFATHGEVWLRDERVPIEGRRCRVRYLPLGPVLAVMPWNFPFWQVVRFAAPALMAGNVALLKHSASVPRAAMDLEGLFGEVLPPGAFQALLVGAAAVPGIIADERVRAVTLTGSDRAGAAVAELAGRYLKKTVLELGGSDPFVVMPSADLDAAARAAVAARMVNSGQSCVAAKRFIVHADVYETFRARFVEGVARLRVGDPLDEDTDVGPLATPAILESLARQVESSLQAGAELLLGGGRPLGPGNYYLPTVLEAVPRGAPAWREELFGPVAVLARARGLDEAIALANDTPYGLASSVWTREREEVRRFEDDLEAGVTFVNGVVASDPRLPFGGVKRSGYGRELGILGSREFVNVKTVVEMEPPVGWR